MTNEEELKRIEEELDSPVFKHMNDLFIDGIGPVVYKGMSEAEDDRTSTEAE